MILGVIFMGTLRVPRGIIALDLGRNLAVVAIERNKKGLIHKQTSFTIFNAKHYPNAVDEVMSWGPYNAAMFFYNMWEESIVPIMQEMRIHEMYDIGIYYEEPWLASKSFNADPRNMWGIIGQIGALHALAGEDKMDGVSVVCVGVQKMNSHGDYPKNMDPNILEAEIRGLSIWKYIDKAKLKDESEIGSTKGGHVRDAAKLAMYIGKSSEEDYYEIVRTQYQWQRKHKS